MIGVVNPNSPLVWDWLMADALIEWADRQPAGCDHAVSARRRDSARLDRRRPRPAGRRVAVGRRPGPDRARGCPGRVRIVLQRRGHAHRRPVVRHARVGARLRRRRPARPPLQDPLPRRRRPLHRKRARRPGGLGVAQHAVGHVHRRLRPGHARRRLARGRPHRQLREVRARPRGAAHVSRRCAAASARATRSSRSTRSARRAPAACSSARSTRSSTSASGCS